MDQINSNSYLNTARLYQGPATPREPAKLSPEPPLSRPAQATPQEAAFSGMFEDDALLQLQKNLEAIGRMAEQTLKRIED